MTVACFLIILMIFGPTGEGLATDLIESAPLSGQIPAGHGKLFDRLEAETTGIDFVHVWDPPEDVKAITDKTFGYIHMLDTGFAGGGVCVGDYDGDTLPDIFLTSPFGGNRLYRNLGGFRFDDVSRRAGIVDSMWGSGATFADFDNDGDEDLYVCGYDSPNRFYVNQGNGTFLEQAEACGLSFKGASVMAAPADYDLDGDLDIYLLTNRYRHGASFDELNGSVRKKDGDYIIADHMLEYTGVMNPDDGPEFLYQTAQYDRLYRNDGDLKFTDVSNQAGIIGTDHGLAATWWDYNHDGHPDLYVSNDFYGPDRFYHNNGDGTFTDRAMEVLPHTPWFSMGSDTGDINNDGMLDYMASDMSSTSHYMQKMGMGDMDSQGWFLEYPDPRQYMRNALYLGTGTGRFMEIAYLAGLADTDWTWSVRFADLDNDGLLDLFVSNGMTRNWFNSDLIRQGDLGHADYFRRFHDLPERREKNLAFRNMGDLRFVPAEEDWGLDYIGVSFGTGVTDLDQDGDLDLVVNNFNEPVMVYRNGSTRGHRVKIRLRGRDCNRQGVGAMVRLETGSGIQVRYITLSRGYISSADPVVHFGLGSDEIIDKLEVHWPGGIVQESVNLAADRDYTFTQPDIGTSMPEITEVIPTLFVSSQQFNSIRHREIPYNDFKRQPLLPNRMSQLGPGMALGDIDSDGDDDFYLGGAAGFAGTIFRNAGNGDFEPIQNFDVELAREDMGSLFFDADSDGDLDLYVVRVGTEAGAGPSLLLDRLYITRGGGPFVTAEVGTLPPLKDSGSGVAAADYDRDGDLDLFVGGRSIPGQYPLPSNSRLLRNDHGKFLDVTDDRAPGLMKSGLVTSAIWSDADQDGWIDLIVTYEWGPVRFYRNLRGRLADQTDESGLSGRRGWWNGIAAGDIDNDRDIDYVVTNFGLNTKYHPTMEKPSFLYYGDFEENSPKCLVEAEFEGDMLYPIRGKSCSTHAMPSLAKRFPTFHDFAVASVFELYSEGTIKESHEYQVNTLESGLLINDGSGRFRFQPLPRLAQVSPGFGVVITEVDGDGNPDIYLAQNFFGPQRETGRMDGGLSLLLTGHGDGTFTPVWPKRSGLVVPGDAKSIVVTDLNGDGWGDFLVGVNDSEVIAWVNRSAQLGNRVFNVQLKGQVGNPGGVGSRVALHRDDGSVQTAEIHAGGGYLSQSSGQLTFGLGTGCRVRKIEVFLPDGRVMEEFPPFAGDRVTIHVPLLQGSTSENGPGQS